MTFARVHTLALIALSFPACGQEPPSREIMQKQWIQDAETVMGVLSDAGVSRSPELEALNSSLGVLIRDPDEPKWQDFITKAHTVAESADIKSEVTIGSSPQNGATVMYQTVLERKEDATPNSFAEPTQSTEELFIGQYYIWTAREEKATSDKNKVFRVIKKSHIWEIQESDAE